MAPVTHCPAGAERRNRRDLCRDAVLLQQRLELVQHGVGLRVASVDRDGDVTRRLVRHVDQRPEQVALLVVAVQLVEIREAAAEILR